MSRSREHAISTPSSNWAALRTTLPSTANAPWRKRKRAPEAPEPGPSTSKAAKMLEPDAVSAGKAEPGKHVALDCEFVGVGPEASESMLARVSVVNFHGHILLDVFVRPKERVTDYRTWVSGVTEHDLRSGGPALPFEDVQKQVADLLKNRILVGHAVQNDLQVLLLSHPRSATRDTSRYAPLRELAGTKRPALRKLAQLVLGISIQDPSAQTGHSSVEDARATMAIYRAHRSDWESSASGASSTRPKKAKSSTVKPVEASEPEHMPRRMASKGRKGTLNLAATMRHAQPADEGELVVHTSESVAVTKPIAKPARTASAASERPSKGARSGKRATGGDGDAGGGWWNSAP